jgi:hypothetical protein
MRRTIPLLVITVVLAGCYRATIDTGLRPSGDEIRNDWAHSYIAGLVPPSTVETAARCPDGVAQVQTQLSFLNMLANVVTLGIYSPMSVLVRCAAAGSGGAEAAFVVPAGSSLEHSMRVFNAALAEAASLQEPVLVRFD